MRLAIGLVAVMISASGVAAEMNELHVGLTVESSIRALNGFKTRNGELAVTCVKGGATCVVHSKNIPIQWKDDADGVPYYVQQLGYRMETAAELFAAMPKGTPVDPMPYQTGGVNPVEEVRTLGAADETSGLIIQCEKRRYWTECLIRKTYDEK